MGLPSKRASDWLVLLAALVGIVVTARLGWWQLERAATKQARQAQIDARGAAPALDAAELAREATAAAAQHYRRVTLRGRWLTRHTVYLDNRPLDGRPGFIVVTPLELAAGDAVAVQRGWVPRDAQQRQRLVPVPAPDGPVQVDGRVAPAPSALWELGPAEPGAIRQNLDLAAYGREIGVALRPLTVQQLGAAASADDPLQRRWPMPAANVGTNYGYAFQWFALCALIAGLYVWYQLIRPRRRRPR